MNSVVIVVAIVQVLIVVGGISYILHMKHKEKSLMDKLMNNISESIKTGELGEDIAAKIKFEIKKNKPVTESPKMKAVVRSHEEAPIITTEESSVKAEEPGNGTQEISLPAPGKLYAGAYIGGSFKSVSSEPNKKTIYEISVSGDDPTEGITSIYKEAYERVSLTPDFLTGACNKRGSGGRPRQIQTGIAVKKDGVWVVKEKILVEFQ